MLRWISAAREAAVLLCALVAAARVAAQPPACGSVVSGSAILQSINYPSAYLDSYSCSWTLQASPASGLIYLQFQAFATESCCDFLRIYNQNGALIYSYSGSSLPPSLTLGSQATVIFTTDSSVPYAGFSIAMSSVAPSPPAGISAVRCGSVVSDATPTLLMSANYPSSYASSVSCNWTVQAAPMCTNISLQLLFFVTEQCCDIVRVYNESQLVYSFSGTQPAQTLTLGRQATVTFITDSSVVYWGFAIVASSVGCTFPRTGRFGSVAASPVASIAQKAPSVPHARSLIECGARCVQNNGVCAAFAYDSVRGSCQLGNAASSLSPTAFSRNYILT